MPLAPLLAGVSYLGLQQAKRVAPAKATAGQLWIVALAARLPLGKVRAAIANKHGRQIRTMLAWPGARPATPNGARQWRLPK